MMHNLCLLSNLTGWRDIKSVSRARPANTFINEEKKVFRLTFVVHLYSIQWNTEHFLKPTRVLLIYFRHSLTILLSCFNETGLNSVSYVEKTECYTYIDSNILNLRWLTNKIRNVDVSSMIWADSVHVCQHLRLNFKDIPY